MPHFDRLGVGLVREGFRLLVEDNNFKIENLIKKFSVIKKVIF